MVLRGTQKHTNLDGSQIFRHPPNKSSRSRAIHAGQVAQGWQRQEKAAALGVTEQDVVLTFHLGMGQNSEQNAQKQGNWTAGTTRATHFGVTYYFRRTAGSPGYPQPPHGASEDFRWAHAALRSRGHAVRIRDDRRGSGVRWRRAWGGFGCKWRRVKTVLGSHFGAFGEFTTHFRTYFSGWIESDVHWRYGILTHGQIVSRPTARVPPGVFPPKSRVSEFFAILFPGIAKGSGKTCGWQQVSLAGNSSESH